MSTVILSTYPVHPAAFNDPTRYAAQQAGAENMVSEHAYEATTFGWAAGQCRGFELRWMAETEVGGDLFEWTPGTAIPEGTLTLHCQAIDTPR